MALTPKQEAFAQAYVETGKAAEAYRRAYKTDKMGDFAVRLEAHRLLKHPNVSAAIQSLTEEARERHKLTVDDIIRELEEARTYAMTGERPQPAAMVAATMGKAKVLGLVTDKQEHTGKDGGPIEHSLKVEFVKPKPR